MPWNLRTNTIQTWDRVRGGQQFPRYNDIATYWQTYGIDYDGPLTDIETDNNVAVPESQIQLTDHQLQELRNRIDPLSDELATMELIIFWTLWQPWKVSLTSNEKQCFNF